jgi:hypothetical protein
MRNRCNFILPKPFIVLSSKGLKRNKYRKYIIYPDLSKFKEACLHCPHIGHENNHYYCKINDDDFMLRFYGIGKDSQKGVFISQGKIPLDLKLHPLSVRVEAFFDYHRTKSKRMPGLRTRNKKYGDRLERQPCFARDQSNLAAW